MVPQNSLAQAAPPVTESLGDFEVSASNPQQMIGAQIHLIGWCKAKIASLERDWKELKEAEDHAIKCKWKWKPLERQRRVCERRMVYYRKVCAALEAGYFIVPNFEATIFAVRTQHKKPMAMISSNWDLRRQTAEVQGPAPMGEGEYLNSIPILQSTDWTADDKKGATWWAESWDEFEFPLALAKPELMEATQRAMALKIFDDLGVTPAVKYERPVWPKGDPLIIGRVFGPKIGYTQRHVSFVIGWYLSTRDI